MVLTGKNIFVTGGTGFIGSHLVERLVSQGANVIVPYQSLDPKSYFKIQNLDTKVILTVCDLKNFKRVLAIVCRYEIDYIFHLGAVAIVTTTYHNPLEAFETNILGTVNVLEAARQYAKISGILVTSSDKAYGKIPRASEKNPVGGDHPYETSKAAADLVARSYHRTYKLPVVVTRFGNVYGEGDLHFNRLVPGICEALVNNKTLDVRSNGKYVRDYLYVEDVVDGYLFLLSKIDSIKGEAFNFSSNDNLSVLDVIKTAEKSLGQKIKYVIKNNEKNEIPYQHLDDSKIRKLGWISKHSLKTSLPSVLEWYKDNL